MKTDKQLQDLRVPGSYDKFSATCKLFELGDHLKISASECQKIYRSFRSHWLTKRRYFNHKNFGRDLLFVVRWMCRGLTYQESVRKWELQLDNSKTWTGRRYNGSYKRQ